MHGADSGDLLSFFLLLVREQLQDTLGYTNFACMLYFFKEFILTLFVLTFGRSTFLREVCTLHCIPHVAIVCHTDVV